MKYRNFLAFIVLLSYSCLFAQTGAPTFGSLQAGGFDTVNLQNLNVNFMVPVVSHAGRGLSFNYALAYNSLVFTADSGAWTVKDGWTSDGLGYVTYRKITPGTCLQTPGMTETTNYAFVDPAGTPHPFSVSTYGFNSCGFTNISSGYATDASGYFINISTAPTIVRGPDGTTYSLNTGASQPGGLSIIQDPTIMDPDGNQISPIVNSSTGETDWTDTLGQTALKILILNGGAETDYNRLAVDGTYQTIARKYQTFNIKTNFACPGVSEYTSSSLGRFLVTEIDLPNNQKYLFSYEATPGSAGYVTGRLQQVTLPTGGTITYQYSGANGGMNCADGTMLNLTRAVTDNITGTSSIWTYSRSISSGSAGTTTVTAPKLDYDSAANQTVVTFDSQGHETVRQMYQGSTSGPLLRTVKTAWGSGSTPISSTIILEDGSTQSEVETSYDSNGNLLTSKEHDWGQGAPGPVLRSTTLGYLSESAYTTVNILNRLQDETVQDASGSIKFRKHIDYDQAGFINTQCPAGASQHDDAGHGCSYTTRGLPTAVTTYTDATTPAGPITQNFSYDWFGNRISAQLNSIQQQQWNFSSATQYAFPDSVTSGPGGGPQLSTSATYYPTTGEVRTSTDENGQVTTYSYADPGHLDRLTDVQRPDLAHLATTYDDLGLTITSTSPVQGTDTVKNVTAFDGLGRLITKKTEDAAGDVDRAISTQYDVLGRVYKTSSPYISSAQSFVTHQFDALGRPTLAILPDGAQTSNSYSLNSATVTDPVGAPKQRKSISDGLGRLIEVDEPGDSFNGTQAQGSITINDPLNTKSGVNATSGSGAVTISGTVLFHIVCTTTCKTVYDTGSVVVSISTPGSPTDASYSFKQGDSALTIANNLASQLSASSNVRNVTVVQNSSTSYTINMTASATGSATNYAYQISATKDFTVSTAGANFTGGTDGQTVSDSGNITLSVGTFTTAPVCYGTSCNSTAAQVASALAGALNVSGSPVHNVSVSGSSILMTANAFSASTVGITATPTSSDPADFPNGSFASQGELSGGADPYPSSLTHPYVTTYQYGVLDNLLQVSQGVQTRTYAYDGMGGITDLSTPEAGHVNLQYNALYQVASRTDARGVVTNYTYDTLNRLHEIDYVVGTTGVPATPSVIYNYGTSAAQNNNGRVTTITDGLGSETYNYDQLGRVTQLQKAINGATYNIGYGYNLANELTSLTYPSGRVVKQSFDGIGRLCEVAPDTTGCGTSTAPYAKTFGYNAALQNTGFTYGNGVAAAFNFSPDRLQLTSMSYVKGTQTLFGLNYYYKQDATNCPTGAAANNGQIQCILDRVDSGRSVSYAYDTLGRLGSAITHGSTGYSQWGLSFTMDRYANMTAQTTTAGSTPQFSVAVNTANNQISTLSYDQNGNMLNDGRNVLVYDAENRTVSSAAGGATSTYSYDCKNLRVVKASGGVTTVYIYSDGKVIAEYQNGAAPTAPTREYIYSGSSMLAQILNGATTYFMRDHLSNRVLADVGGNVLGEMGHFPYGQSWYDSNLTKWKFTTYERDSESQNDYAVARYYINLMDRFSSPDPVIGTPGNAQSWNRYSYVANDPINVTDPTGQFVVAWERLFLSNAIVDAEAGGDCTMDGIDTGCGLLQLFLNGNGVAQCPNNVCNRVAWLKNPEGGAWANQEFWAFANGGSGYYSMSGPGSLNYSADQAGDAAGQYFESKTTKDKRERGGAVYEDANEIFSYDYTAISAVPCLEDRTCRFDFIPVVPDGTSDVGIWHTHPFQGGVAQFSIDRDAESNKGFRVPSFVGYAQSGQNGVMRIDRTGTPSLLFDRGSGLWMRVLPICSLSGPGIGDIGSCN
jgi:RHS repeat-associated protein